MPECGAELAGAALMFGIQGKAQEFISAATALKHYKGRDRYDTADAEEKRLIGEVWAARSGGRCLFVMPRETDFSVITAAVRR